MRKRLIILICFFLFQFILDLSTNECYLRLNKDKKEKAFEILFIHHLFSIFANFGWILSDNKIFLSFYLLFPISTLIYWGVNNNKCDLTVEFNKLCGYTHYEYFHDIFYFTKTKLLHPAYYVLISLYVLGKIIKK